MVVTSILTCAIWLTQTLRFVDLVLSKGLPLTSFIGMTLLLVPDLVAILSPFGILFGALFTFYRLQGDSEITVMKAVGASNWYLARGPISIALVLSIAVMAINFYVLPASFQRFKDREHILKNADSPIKVRPRIFQHFGGFSVYIGGVKSDGIMHDVFVFNKKPKDGSFAYTAEKGQWILNNGELRLMLFGGTQQRFGKAGKQPEMLQFEEYYLDLPKKKTPPREGSRKPFELSPKEIFSQKKSDGSYPPNLWSELNRRIINPIMALVFVTLSLGIFLQAPFNRRGHLKPALTGIVLCFGIQILVLVGVNRLETHPFIFTGIYGVSLLALLWGGYLLLIKNKRGGKSLCPGN